MIGPYGVAGTSTRPSEAQDASRASRNARLIAVPPVFPMWMKCRVPGVPRCGRRAPVGRRRLALVDGLAPRRGGGRSLARRRRERVSPGETTQYYSSPARLIVSNKKVLR
jgi:hypothetical protein